jgi:hypothetical protein
MVEKTEGKENNLYAMIILFFMQGQSIVGMRPSKNQLKV